MKRVALAGVLGGLAFFAWGAVSWMVLPFHTASLNTLPGEPQDVDRWLQRLPQAGIYHYPGFPHNADGSPATDSQMEAAFDRMRRGPRITFMVYRPDGCEPFPPQKFLLGLSFDVLAAGLLAWMIWMVRASLPSFGRRVAAAMLMATLAVVLAILPSALWWSHPAEFVALEVTDILVGSSLAGLIIAKLVPGPSAMFLRDNKEAGQVPLRNATTS